MASNLVSVFSKSLEGDKGYLGLGEFDKPVENRFSFIEAKKREDEDHYSQVEIGSGESARNVHAYFHYMLDNSTDDLYILHKSEELPQYFMMAVIATPFVMIASTIWSLAVIVASTVNGLFEIFQEIYPVRQEEDLTATFLKRLEEKTDEKFEAIKDRLKWIKDSLGYGVALEAAALHALSNASDEEILFSMKVVIARIEYLWNKKESFRKSNLSQLNHFNKDLAERMKKEPTAVKGDVTIELLKCFDWKAFVNVCYIMQCFQSRGAITDEVAEETLKFEVVEKSRSGTSKEFTHYLDMRRKEWQGRI